MRRDRAYLEDMIAAADRIMEYVRGCDLEQPTSAKRAGV